MVIKSSKVVKPETYVLEAGDSLHTGIIRISGYDVIVDFQNAVIESNKFPLPPDQYSGLAIHVTNGRNITLKNLTIRGFKVAIRADEVVNLKLENIDASYNYRQKLKSKRDREDLGDWMSYHDNENDEWLRYGAAFYLKHCYYPEISGCRAVQGQCGLMMVDSYFGEVYNNNFSFNSAIGIGLYRSKSNRIIHNKLDWNVRGYSHGIYRRGQDSAGILVYEQSSENVIAYNSATHSGDGFFLWAGNASIQTGQGGSNDNLIYRNDFSHAPTNGVEVTFSSNRVIENLLNDCRYGVWAGYSYHSVFSGNQIKDCEYGIAVEHGNHNQILANYFENDSLGIQLWEREVQPDSWEFSKVRNIESRQYQIFNNQFENVQYPFHIRDSDSLEIRNNTLMGEVTEFFGRNNRHLILSHSDEKRNVQAQNLSVANLLRGDSLLVIPLENGQDAFLPAGHPRGVEFIYINEWGPYNFEYPSIFLSASGDEKLNFSLLGPEGNWKVVDSRGFRQINPLTGVFPSNIEAVRMDDAEELFIQLEFIGNEFTDQFGQTHPKGKPYPFSYRLYDKPLLWEISWSSYPEELDPVSQYPQWIEFVRDNSLAQEEYSQITFRWWGAPAEGVDSDGFATLAKTEAEFQPGIYRVLITSDDGLKFFVDGVLKIDHWDIHEAVTDTLEIELDGIHRFDIEHFEGEGIATLDFRMERVSSGELRAASPDTEVDNDH